MDLVKVTTEHTELTEKGVFHIYSSIHSLLPISVSSVLLSEII